MTITAGSITKDLEQYESEATLDDLYQSKDTRHWMDEICRYVRKRAHDSSSRQDSKEGRALKTLKKASSLAEPPQLWINAPDTVYILMKAATRLPQSQDFSLQQAYELTTTLTGDLWFTVIRLRFLHLLFFDVSNALLPDFQKITANLLNLVTRELQLAGQTTVDQNLLCQWIRTGRVYNSLIGTLDEGCLFLMPDNIPPTVWEHLSTSADQAASFLTALGIQEKIKHHNATEKGRQLRRELTRHIFENLHRPGIDTSDLQASASTQITMGDAENPAH